MNQKVSSSNLYDFESLGVEGAGIYVLLPLYSNEILYGVLLCDLTEGVLVNGEFLGNQVSAAVKMIMVLQIAGSGGTYPIEALPNFFRQVYIFFPFPYAINAMRECIGGMYHADLFKYLLELSIFIVVALVIGLIIRKPFIHIMHFIEKRMEDTDMM